MCVRERMRERVRGSVCVCEREGEGEGVPLILREYYARTVAYSSAFGEE